MLFMEGKHMRVTIDVLQDRGTRSTRTMTKCCVTKGTTVGEENMSLYSSVTLSTCVYYMGNVMQTTHKEEEKID